MIELESSVNFGDMQGYKTIVYDTEVVPDDIWAEAQRVHNESIRALLPAEEWDRADFITQQSDFEAYRDTRVDPNILVGTTWNDDQLFRHPKFATIFDRSHQLVGGVLTADNSSARLLPRPLSPIEYWAKMLLPPGLAVPALGNRRFDHLREVFTHPEAQPKLDVDEATVSVSGIAVVGVYNSLKYANSLQSLTAYVLRADLADRELTNLTNVLGMTETGYQRPHSLPYYKEDKLVRVSAQVGQVIQGISELPGAKEAIEGVGVMKWSKAPWIM